MNRDKAAENRHVTDWNSRNRVGCVVRVRTEEGVLQTRTRQKARMDLFLGPVVWVDGLAGFVPLSDVECTEADLEAAGQLGLLPDDAA